MTLSYKDTTSFEWLDLDELQWFEADRYKDPYLWANDDLTWVDVDLVFVDSSTLMEKYSIDDFTWMNTAGFDWMSYNLSYFKNSSDDSWAETEVIDWDDTADVLWADSFVYWRDSADRFLQAEAAATEDYTLIVDEGAYALTGSAVALYSTLESGSYVQTGSAVTLALDYKLVADSGSYNIDSPTTLLIFSTVSVPDGWLGYNNLGPWDFEEQPNKWGYLNNPFWTNVPERAINYTGNELNEPQIWSIDKSHTSPSGTQHVPCGHWHKVVVPGSGEDVVSNKANIYGLFAVGAAIYGVYFNGSSLKPIGTYDSPSGDINGLVLIDDVLLTVGGIGSSASLRQISTSPVNGLFPLVNESYPFNNYDVTASTYGKLIRNADNGTIYYHEGTVNNAGGRLLKISPELTKELRSFLGTVVIGTDSNLYYGTAYWSNFNSAKRPVTGSSWDGFYLQIPDNISDRIPQVWNTGTAISNISSNENQWTVFSDSLYGVTNASPSGYVIRYDLTTLNILAQTRTDLGLRGVIGYGNYVYTVASPTYCELRKLDKTTLATIKVVNVVSARAANIFVVNGELILLCSIYTGSAYIYKIDPDDLSVIDSSNLGPSILWQKMAVINDTFVALGGNNNVGVFNIVTMEMVDAIAAPETPGSHYSTRDLVVQNI